MYHEISSEHQTDVLQPAGPPDQYLTLTLRRLGFDTFDSNLLSIPAQVLTTINVRILKPLPYPSKADHNPPDDDNDLRLRKNQPARLHGHLLPDLVPPLPNRAAPPPDLDLEPVDDVRHSDHAVIVPDTSSYPSRLVQSDQQQHSHEDRVRRYLQYFCAGTEYCEQ
jgi:hypothetical protein